jgi:hypothetical protein
LVKTSSLHQKWQTTTNHASPLPHPHTHIPSDTTQAHHPAQTLGTGRTRNPQIPPLPPNLRPILANRL